MSLRITLRQLEYFIAAGEAESITGAAEKINISPPSISMAVSTLEREFGVQLFVRHHAQGLSLTFAGRSLLVQSKQLLSQAETLCSSAYDLSEQVRGDLSVGCLVTLAPMVLPELTHAFITSNPTTEIHLFEGNQERLLQALIKAELEVAITYDLDLPPNMMFRPLVSLPPHVMVGETHPLARRESLTLEELEHEDYLLLDMPMSADYFLSLFQTANIKPKIRYRSSSPEVVRTMVANGQGYGLANALPRSDLALDGRRVIRLRLAGDHRPMTIGLVSLVDVQKSKLFRAFENHCRERISSSHIPGMVSPLEEALATQPALTHS